MNLLARQKEDITKTEKKAMGEEQIQTEEMPEKEQIQTEESARKY